MAEPYYDGNPFDIKVPSCENCGRVFGPGDDIDYHLGEGDEVYCPECCPSCSEGHTPSVRFPDITVRLVGTDSHAFSIISTVERALRRGGVDREVIAEFRKEAMSGDYDNVLATAMRWVEVE